MEGAGEMRQIDPGRTTTNGPGARRFTLSDVLILVAVTAPGLVVLRAYHANRPPPHPFHPLPIAWAVSLEAAPFLVAASVGLLAARFRGPWSRPRRIFRQPGMVACVAILAH